MKRLLLALALLAGAGPAFAQFPGSSGTPGDVDPRQREWQQRQLQRQQLEQQRQQIEQQRAIQRQQIEQQRAIQRQQIEQQRIQQRQQFDAQRQQQWQQQQWQDQRRSEWERRQWERRQWEERQRWAAPPPPVIVPGPGFGPPGFGPGPRFGPGPGFGPGGACRVVNRRFPDGFVRPVRECRVCRVIVARDEFGRPFRTERCRWVRS